MIEKMYYDMFANEYCAIEAAEEFAPPERYLPTYRGDDIYIETYDCKGLRLHIAYSETDVKIGNVNHTRYSVAAQHGYNLSSATMIRWTIPSKKFDEYAKMFGISNGERKDDDKSCDTCKHHDKGLDDIVCDGCTKAHSNWERRDDD